MVRLVMIVVIRTTELMIPGRSGGHAELGGRGRAGEPLHGRGDRSHGARRRGGSALGLLLLCVVLQLLLLLLLVLSLLPITIILTITVYFPRFWRMARPRRPSRWRAKPSSSSRASGPSSSWRRYVCTYIYIYICIYLVLF